MDDPTGPEDWISSSGHGATKVEAAETARADAERLPAQADPSTSSPASQAPTAEAQASTPAPTINIGTDEGAGQEQSTVVRDAERKAAEFGWRIAYAREPDDSFTWIVSDATTGEALQSGQADDWDDAKLASILNLYPPSGEK